MENKTAIIGSHFEGRKPPTYFAINKDSGKEITSNVPSMDDIIETLKQLGYKIVK